MALFTSFTKLGFLLKNARKKNRPPLRFSLFSPYMLYRCSFTYSISSLQIGLIPSLLRLI